MPLTHVYIDLYMHEIIMCQWVLAPTSKISLVEVFHVLVYRGNRAEQLQLAKVLWLHVLWVWVCVWATSTMVPWYLGLVAVVLAAGTEGRHTLTNTMWVSLQQNMGFLRSQGIQIGIRMVGTALMDNTQLSIIEQLLLSVRTCHLTTTMQVTLRHFTHCQTLMLQVGEGVGAFLCWRTVHYYVTSIQN